MQYIAFDAHKRYTFASVLGTNGELAFEGRIDHRRGALKEFLSRCDSGSPVAVETVGNWYWIVGEIEEAGMEAKLVNARRAKMMLSSGKKTDKLDARGMNRLQRSGTLPTVWIPGSELRDQRELFRTRMVLSKQRTRLKNRIQATLAKYGLTVEGLSDVFGKKGRRILEGYVAELPQHTRFCVERLLMQLDMVAEQIQEFEQRMEQVFEPTEELRLIRSLPGVGLILGVVIVSEVGDVNRFPSAEDLASYAGTTPRVHASGGKVRYGPVRSDANHYLKWSFAEAANVIATRRRQYPHRHATRLYERIRQRRDHQRAVGAVARHLAEATYWMLKKREEYREPSFRPRKDKRATAHEPT